MFGICSGKWAQGGLSLAAAEHLPAALVYYPLPSPCANDGERNGGGGGGGTANAAVAADVYYGLLYITWVRRCTCYLLPLGSPQHAWTLLHNSWTTVGPLSALVFLANMGWDGGGGGFRYLHVVISSYVHKYILMVINISYRIWYTQVFGLKYMVCPSTQPNPELETFWDVTLSYSVICII